jgi:hypothetical protein
VFMNRVVRRCILLGNDAVTGRITTMPAAHSRLRAGSEERASARPPRACGLLL